MYLYTPAFRLIDIDETTHFLPMAPLGSVGQEYSLFARWLKVSANDQCKIMSMAGVPRGGGLVVGPMGVSPQGGGTGDTGGLQQMRKLPHVVLRHTGAASPEGSQ